MIIYVKYKRFYFFRKILENAKSRIGLCRVTKKSVFGEIEILYLAGKGITSPA